MAFKVLRSGSFPYQAYVAACDCIDGKEEPTLNYAHHAIAPPKCSACKRPYHLDTDLMPTSAASQKGASPKGKQ